MTLVRAIACSGPAAHLGRTWVMGLQEFAGPRSPGSHHLFPLFLANIALPGLSWRSLQPLYFEAGLKRIEGPYSNLLRDPNNPEGECLAGARPDFILNLLILG